MQCGIIEKIFNKLVEFCSAIGSLYICFLMLVIVRDVGGRLILGSSIMGTAEIVANSLVAILFLQITFVLHENRHIQATILYDKLPLKVRLILDIITYLIGIGLFVLIIYSGWDLFITAVQIGEYEGEGGFHFYTSPVRFMILFGSALMCIQFVIFIIHRVIKLKTLNYDMTEK